MTFELPGRLDEPCEDRTFGQYGDRLSAFCSSLPGVRVNATDPPGMGFQAAARGVARRQGLPMDRARAIIAAGARRASPAAKRRNPRLRRVAGY